ncbi:MAG TPA: hypothetical protein VHW66_07525 [Stellaceae bacterium]|jgi:hypothetical protein|nr:hypothetical protein [Stellaceae bacterium]
MARWVDESERGEARRTAALAGLALTLALAVLGIMLVRALRDESRLEDCLMQGRRNCAPIEMPASR